MVKKTATKIADPEDVGLLVNLEIGSFNRAERDVLQRKYRQEFERLMIHVTRTVFNTKNDEDDEWFDGGSLRSLDGEPIFADQVLIDMMAIVMRRDDPEFDAAVFDEMTMLELITAVFRGREANPKA